MTKADIIKNGNWLIQSFLGLMMLALSSITGYSYYRFLDVDKQVQQQHIQILNQARINEEQNAVLIELQRRIDQRFDRVDDKLESIRVKIK